MIEIELYKYKDVGRLPQYFGAYCRHTMINSDLNDLVLSKVSLNRSELSTLANDISLIGLLSVHTETILVTVDSHSVKRQLVCSTEDTDGNFTTVSNENLLHLHDGGVRAEAVVHVGVIVRRHPGGSVLM